MISHPNGNTFRPFRFNLFILRAWNTHPGPTTVMLAPVQTYAKLWKHSVLQAATGFSGWEHQMLSINAVIQLRRMEDQLPAPKLTKSTTHVTVCVPFILTVQTPFWQSLPTRLCGCGCGLSPSFSTHDTTTMAAAESMLPICRHDNNKIYLHKAGLGPSSQTTCFRKMANSI